MSSYLFRPPAPNPAAMTAATSPRRAGAVYLDPHLSMVRPGPSANHARLPGMPADGLAVAAPAPMPELRARRLLRLLADAPRPPARPRYRSSHRALLRAGGGLALVLRR